MKTKPKIALVAVLIISLLTMVIVTGNVPFTEGSNYGLESFFGENEFSGDAINNTSSTNDFVHPGIGFEDVKESEYFIDAYGVRPDPEMRTEEWAGKLEETHYNLIEESIETGFATVFRNLNTKNESAQPTMKEIREAFIENNIDISSGLIKYFFGGESGPIVYDAGIGDGFIVIGTNAEEINESLKDEIYDLYYQRGKELGIDDIPVVFEISGPFVFD